MNGPSPDDIPSRMTLLHGGSRLLGRGTPRQGNLAQYNMARASDQARKSCHLWVRAFHTKQFPARFLFAMTLLGLLCMLGNCYMIISFPVSADGCCSRQRPIVSRALAWHKCSSQYRCTHLHLLYTRIYLCCLAHLLAAEAFMKTRTMYWTQQEPKTELTQGTTALLTFA